MCWTGVAGYLAACWRTLASRPDVALKIITFDEFGTANTTFPCTKNCPKPWPQSNHPLEQILPTGIMATVDCLTRFFQEQQ
jgi:hypothetical protein